MIKEKALVIFSGGQDSTTCLYWAIDKFDAVEAICFNYGQRHIVEIEAAKAIAQAAHINLKVLELPLIADLTKNSLVDISIDVDSFEETVDTPNTLVEGRNLLFISYAAIYAKSLDISNLIMGVGQTDFSGYPDCRESFIRSANQSISLALDYQMLIHTPLMWKTKAETWAMADQLGVLEVIKEKTVTCYNGLPGDGCGKCPACHLRTQGYNEYINREKKNG